MEIINVHAAKTHLSRLLDQVVEGEEFILAKAGKPMAKLVALDKEPSKKSKKKEKKREFGQFRGEIWTSPNFDDEDPEINKMFGMD